MSTYAPVPDAPLMTMCHHAHAQLAEWERHLERDRKALDGSIRMVDHWKTEITEIQDEIRSREEASK